MKNGHQYRMAIVILLMFSLACSIEDPVSSGGGSQFGTTIDLLALGDSYTIGQGVSAAESWPAQLKNRLVEQGIIVDKVKIIASTGWSTRSLLNAIRSEDLGTLNTNRLVSLQIGVNNQYQQLPFEEFKDDFDFLLDTAIQLADLPERVFVVSIPDYSVTPFAKDNGFDVEKISQEIEAYNLFMANRCKELDITFINVTETSRELGDSDGALSDGLHPSAYQYGRWVEIILPYVTTILI
ncbi:MAG: SGNH/GDSL hydrolase family protein [Bacteroidota bacterium]